MRSHNLKDYMQTIKQSQGGFPIAPLNPFGQSEFVERIKESDSLEGEPEMQGF
jgi:hypothetical protein